MIDPTGTMRKIEEYTDTTGLNVGTGSVAGNSALNLLMRSIADSIIITSVALDINNFNVNTEETLLDLIGPNVLAQGIIFDYTDWLTDANIAASGATLTIRVYIDQPQTPWNLTEITNQRQVITEGVSLSGIVQIPDIMIRRDYRITVQSSIAPVGGADTRLVAVGLEYRTFA